MTWPTRPDWAMVLGGAECLQADVSALSDLVGGPWPGIVVAANDAGAWWPDRLDHWATLHPERLATVCHTDGIGGWEAQRAARGYCRGYTRWARRAEHLVDEVLDSWNGGSSGLYCITVAHHVTHPARRKVVLCGVPMDSTAHFHDGHGGASWRQAEHFWKVWERHMERLQDGDWLRSLSGRTRSTFGAPDLDWLNEEGCTDG